MNIVKISGGLGNQMFIYAFLNELRYLGFSNTHLWISSKYAAFGHQGYELANVFVLPSYDSETSLTVKIVMFFYKILRHLPMKCCDFVMKLMNIKNVSISENFVYFPDVFTVRGSLNMYSGTWQSEKYFSHISQKDFLNRIFQFRSELLNQKTIELAQSMKMVCSVSVHIRRGDYLSPQYVQGTSGICTLSYYKRAIHFFMSQFSNAIFYFFSDDIEWVKQNFKHGNAVFVQHNIGTDSWQDLYLMSCCRHNIIANSSFSWWGAYLNSYSDKIVIAPKIWWQGVEDDVVPESWIRM